MITDEILAELKLNRYNYNTKAQIKDIDLICNFLKSKYNSEELNDVSLLLRGYPKSCVNSINSV